MKASSPPVCIAHQLWLFAIDSGPSASLIRFHPRLRASRWLCAMDKYRKSRVFVASARIRWLCAITAPLDARRRDRGGCGRA